MKIALITTLPTLSENQRIREEVVGLGHKFELVDLQDFSFAVNEKIKIDGLTDLVADVVIVRGIFLSIKAISAYIISLREKGIKIFDNNFLNHRYSIDKVVDLVKLSLADIPIPATSYARDFEKYPEVAGEIGYPLVVKSTRMGKGSNVFKVISEKELVSLAGDLESSGKKAKSYLMQKFIDYKHDLRVLIVGNHIYAMERIPPKGDFRANFSLGGSVKLFSLNGSDEALSKKALKAIDMSVGGVDILISQKQKRYILEVNHTAGMIGMEEATGNNITRLYVEHAIKNAK